MFLVVVNLKESFVITITATGGKFICMYVVTSGQIYYINTTYTEITERLSIKKTSNYI